MFRVICLFTICFSLLKQGSAQQYGTLKDDRDGKVYKTVKIGEQVWMAENLNTDRFRNGDIIPEVKNKEEWEKATNEKKPAWCYYDFDQSNGKKFGKLYNYFVIVDKRGISPVGFKIPENADFDKLLKFCKDKYSWIGHAALISVNYWNDTIYHSYYGDYRLSNLSGWNALPGGEGEAFVTGMSENDYKLSFEEINHDGTWWATVNKGEKLPMVSPTAYGMRLSVNNYGTYVSGGIYTFRAIRCIKE